MSLSGPEQIVARLEAGGRIDYRILLNLDRVTRPFEGKGATMSLASLPTNGRVLIQTTLGDIEVELWSRVSKHLRPNGNATENGYRNVRKRVEISLPWPWKVVCSRYQMTAPLVDHA